MTKLKKNHFLTVALANFNAKSQTWFKDDKTSYEGSRLGILTCCHGLHQLINEPTHLPDSSSSCIDLIFTSQPNLVMESDVQPSLHPNYHTSSLRLIYPSIILHLMKSNMVLQHSECWFHPEGNRLVWLGKALRFNYVDKEVAIFSDTLINIIQNLVPNKTIICSEREPK